MWVGQLMRGMIGEPQPDQAKALELRIGQVVRGVVLQLLDGKDALVMLNGVQVRARLETPLAPGQPALLQVSPESTAGAIVLRQAEAATAQPSDATLRELMRLLGLPDKRWAAELALDLRRGGYPVNRETGAALREAAAVRPADVPEAEWMQAAATAWKRGLPVTESTVAALRQAMFGKPLGELLESLRNQLAALAGRSGAGAGGPSSGQAAGGAMPEAASRVLALLADGEELLAGPAGRSTAPANAPGGAAGSSGAAAAANGAASRTGGANPAASAGQAAQTGQPQAGQAQAPAGAAPSVAVSGGAAGGQVPDGSAVGAPAAGVRAQQPSAQAAQAPGQDAGQTGAAAAPQQAAAQTPQAAARQGGAQMAHSVPQPQAAERQAAAQTPQAATRQSAPQTPQSASQPQAAAPQQTSVSPGGNWVHGLLKWLGVDYEKQLSQLAGARGEAAGAQRGAAEDGAAASGRNAEAGAGRNADGPGTAERAAPRHGQGAFPLPPQAAEAQPARAGGSGFAAGEPLKQALLQLVGAEDVPAAVRETAQQLVQQITGQQLLLAPEKNGALFSHMTLFIPFQGEDGGTTARITIQSRRGRKDELDPDNCRLLFDLRMRNLGDTVVDVQVVDRFVSLNVWNDHPALGRLLEASRDEAAEALGRVGYQLTSMHVKPFPDAAAAGAGKERASSVPLPDPAAYAGKPYKGVDLRL